MIPQLVSRPFAVESVFAAPFLYVSPSFQRPFAWAEDNAERLLGDIQAACASAPDDIYFLGAVLLVRVPLPGEADGGLSEQAAFAGPERVFEIVDGQQRLVTLALLLAVLRDLLGREGAALSPARQRLMAALATAEASVVRVRLRGPDSLFLHQCIGAPGACLEAPSIDLQSEAQRHLLDVRDLFVHQLSPLEADELARLAVFVLGNCTVVSIVTNTIDRAYQMFTVLNATGKKLTRSDILKAELIAAAPAAERSRLTEIWDDLERRLGTKFEDLFSYVRTLFGRGAEPIVEAVRAQVAAMPGGSQAFIDKMLAPAGRILDVILREAHEGTSQSAEISAHLRYLGWLSSKEWVPPLLGYWLRHGSDAAQLLSFLRTLDRFAFGVRVHGLGADKRGQRMVELAKSIAGGAPAQGPWAPLQLSRDELRIITFNLRDLHDRCAPACKLVLQRLNEYLGGLPIPATQPMTIEHILPSKTGADSRWRVDFPDPEQRQKLAGCLGNLTLVPKGINDRAANHDFARKSLIYFGAGAETLCAMTAELRGVAAWTPRHIEARRARLNAALQDLWQFDDGRQPL